MIIRCEFSIEHAYFFTQAAMVMSLRLSMIAIINSYKYNYNRHIDFTITIRFCNNYNHNPNCDYRI